MIDDQVGVWHSFNCVTNLEPVFSWRQVFHLVTQIFGEHRLSRVLGHENVFFFKLKPLISLSNFNILSSPFLQTSTFLEKKKDSELKNGVMAVLGWSFLETPHFEGPKRGYPLQKIWIFFQGYPILAPQSAVSPKMTTPALPLTQLF